MCPGVEGVALRDLGDARPKLASVSADDLDMVVSGYLLLTCLYCDQDDNFKRLEFLLFHNHFSTTPTRGVECGGPGSGCGRP